MSVLDHPQFGRIRYRSDEGWAGRIHLPRFAECRDAESDEVFARHDDDAGQSVEEMRERQRHEKEQRALAEGRFELMICDAEQQGPTAAQQQAVAFLIDQESEILDVILQWVLKTYRGQEYWTLDGLQSYPGTTVNTLKELKSALRLESVMVHEQSTGPMIPITFYFRSSLDLEHGIEVTTVGKQLEEEDSLGDQDPMDSGVDHKTWTFPFSLPQSIDASPIEPREDGHRFVELLYDGRWSGIYVLDPSLQCVANLGSSVPRPLSAPNDVQGVRALTRWVRWRATPWIQITASAAVGFANVFLTLPLLILAWMYQPRLFWVCLALGIAAHAVFYVFHSTRRHLFGLATGHIVLSIGGLCYASRAREVGGPQHGLAVENVLHPVLWWGSCFVTVIAAIVVLATIVDMRKDFRRDTLASSLFAGSGVLCVTALVLGLLATSFWQWSSWHLLWMVPSTLVGSLVLHLIAMVFVTFTDPPTTPCPRCGKPLASPAAKQCLHCGADWHEQR